MTQMLTGLNGRAPFINEPASDRSNVHFTYQPTSRSPYYLYCSFFSSFARLFVHDVKQNRTSKHVREPVPRLQNELFLALQMRRRVSRKDSRCWIHEKLGDQLKQEFSLSAIT